MNEVGGVARETALHLAVQSAAGSELRVDRMRNNRVKVVQTLLVRAFC